MRLSFFTLLGALFIVSGTYSIAASSEKEECRELETLLRRKPDFIHFVSCKRRSDLQGAPMEAIYRTEGNHAAQAEGYLVDTFKIKKLSRTCCIWESANNSYRDARKLSFLISMSTEETTIDKRRHWARINYFYIGVDLFRDEP